VRGTLKKKLNRLIIHKTPKSHSKGWAEEPMEEGGQSRKGSKRGKVEKRKNCGREMEGLRKGVLASRERGGKNRAAQTL